MIVIIIDRNDGDSNADTVTGMGESHLRTFISHLSSPPWIHPRDELKTNGAPGNIQGSSHSHGW